MELLFKKELKNYLTWVLRDVVLSNEIRAQKHSKFSTKRNIVLLFRLSFKPSHSININDEQFKFKMYYKSCSKETIRVMAHEFICVTAEYSVLLKGTLVSKKNI